MIARDHHVSLTPDHHPCMLVFRAINILAVKARAFMKVKIYAYKLLVSLKHNMEI